MILLLINATGPRAMIPFYRALISVLPSITLVPGLVMTLSRLLGASDRRCNALFSASRTLVN
jgi:hypothetical protein